MERNVRNRNPLVTLLAVVVATLATVILAAPYAGEFAAGGSGHAAEGGSTVVPCLPAESPAAPPDAARANRAAGPGWATEEKLGGR